MFCITERGEKAVANGQVPKVKSLAKALRLLECFTIQEPEWGVTELAEKLDMAKSNAHSIISTFEQMGYIIQLPNKKYTLGLKLLEFAFIINQNLGYPKAIYDLVLKAANLTDQIVYFGVPYGDKVLYLYVAHPVDRMHEIPYREILGENVPLCSAGIGKAILAAMPEEEWMDRIPEHPIKYTPNTLTDREEIIDELRSIKRRGFAIDNMEHHTNIRCVGVPVYNGAGQLVAGISTSGPCDVMTDEKLMECAGILKNIALQMKERIYH